MAPELLVNDLRLKDASIFDLMQADEWAYGMVVFNIINPGLQHPYERNIEMCPSNTPMSMLQDFVKKNEMPAAQDKYQELHRREWAGLKKVYESCAQVHLSSRPTMKKVISMIRTHRHPSAVSDSTLQKNPIEIHLLVSQSTAIQNVDQELQNIPAGNLAQSAEIHIPDDATNACAFLAILIAHELIESEHMSWDCIAETAESIIVSFPHVFNRFRDVSMHYDVMEAYTLLKDKNCFPTEIYDFTEELPYPLVAKNSCLKR